jgi:hypothetical protein
MPGLFSLDMLETLNPENRRKGYAKKITAIAIWCAKRAGYSAVETIAIHTIKNMHGSGRPNSSRLFNSLGFTLHATAQNFNSNTNNNTSEFRRLNLKRNIPNVNAVVRSFY